MTDQAAPQTASLNTMLQTIETGTEILQRVMPEVAVVGGFVPGATPFIQIVGMALGPVQNAIKFIMQESGKDPMAAFEDFLMHIGPNNGYVSPSLSKPVPDSALAPIATGTGD
jgi:ribosomal protein S7